MKPKSGGLQTCSVKAEIGIILGFEVFVATAQLGCVPGKQPGTIHKEMHRTVLSQLHVL